MTSDEFRRHGHAVVDWIADYRDRIESFPVLSQVKPGAVRAALPPRAPLPGDPFAALPTTPRLRFPGIFRPQAWAFREGSGQRVPPAQNWKRMCLTGWFPCLACRKSFYRAALAAASFRTPPPVPCSALSWLAASAPRVSPAMKKDALGASS